MNECADGGGTIEGVLLVPAPADCPQLLRPESLVGCCMETFVLVMEPPNADCPQLLRLSSLDGRCTDANGEKANGRLEVSPEQAPHAFEDGCTELTAAKSSKPRGTRPAGGASETVLLAGDASEDAGEKTWAGDASDGAGTAGMSMLPVRGEADEECEGKAGVASEVEEVAKDAGTVPRTDGSVSMGAELRASGSSPAEEALRFLGGLLPEASQWLAGEPADSATGVGSHFPFPLPLLPLRFLSPKPLEPPARRVAAPTCGVLRQS